MSSLAKEERIEIADIFRRHGERFRRTHRLPREHLRAMRAIENCRTAALGGHIQQCDRCGHEVPAYNSCRNRHCPKCLAPARRRWIRARESELLPVPYFHVVFTIPAPIEPVVIRNRRAMYGILFRAVRETLLEISADEKHLGAVPGILAVLHTWGQTLSAHTHIHCVVPAGGMSRDGMRWVQGDSAFLLPVRVLSEVFRGKFMDFYRAACNEGVIRFPGRIAHLADEKARREMNRRLYAVNWVVYAKRPFGGPAQVLSYLAQYTHRVAITNHRIEKLENGRVTFRYKDYRDHETKRLTLNAEEFIRRFLLHILPARFMKIRSFGFLANRDRRKKIERCRALIRGARAEVKREEERCVAEKADGISVPEYGEGPLERRCPVCHEGEMKRRRVLPPVRWNGAHAPP